MNWDYWLPWRSKYGSQCNHEWEKSVEETDQLNWQSATYEDGHVIVPWVERVEMCCKHCDKDYGDYLVDKYECVVRFQFDRQCSEKEIAIPAALNSKRGASLEEAAGEAGDRTVVNKQTETVDLNGS
jgi:hypothetical protein